MTKPILIIRNAYSHDFGGGERFPVFLAQSLRKFNYKPIIVSRHPVLLEFAGKNGIVTRRGWWWSKQTWNGLHVALFPAYAIWQTALYLWYHHLFATTKPRVVHIQSKDDFIAATYAAAHLGIRVVWTDHADLKHIWKNIRMPFKNPLGKWVYRAAHHAEAITVVSNSELHEVTQYLPSVSPVRNKLMVIYNGCADVLDHYPVTSHADFIYVIASRLVVDKGVGEAIDAFTRLHTDHSDTRLIIAGDGPHRQRFHEQAAQIDAIEFIGHQNDPYQAISQGDVFLQPTYHEGFSVVLVEACMLARPIIATDVGGNSEIILNNKTGLLIPAKDAAALYKAMKRLYRNTKLCTQLAQTARTQYEGRFVFDTIVEEGFVPLYEKNTH